MSLTRLKQTLFLGVFADKPRLLLLAFPVVKTALRDFEALFTIFARHPIDQSVLAGDAA